MSLFHCISLKETVVQSPSQYVILTVWSSLFFLVFVLKKMLIVCSILHCKISASKARHTFCEET